MFEKLEEKISCYILKQIKQKSQDQLESIASKADEIRKREQWGGYHYGILSKKASLRRAASRLRSYWNKEEPYYEQLSLLVQEYIILRRKFSMRHVIKNHNATFDYSELDKLAIAEADLSLGEKCIFDLIFVDSKESSHYFLRYLVLSNGLMADILSQDKGQPLCVYDDGKIEWHECNQKVGEMISARHPESVLKSFNYVLRLLNQHIECFSNNTSATQTVRVNF
jgi:hypothetical protein